MHSLLSTPLALTSLTAWRRLVLFGPSPIEVWAFVEIVIVLRRQAHPAALAVDDEFQPTQLAPVVGILCLVLVSVVDFGAASWAVPRHLP